MKEIDEIERYLADEWVGSKGWINKDIPKLIESIRNELKKPLIRRYWEMPNSETFRIKAFRDLIFRYSLSKQPKTIIDPFANAHSIKEHLKHCIYISNDLDPKYNCDFSLEANEFLGGIEDCSVDVVLYDPPYSPRQVKEVYTSLNKTVTIQDTQSSYWTAFKKEIARVLKPGGICISFGWNTNGIGMNNNFEIIEIVIVAHGGSKNDTLATVEKKSHHQEKLDLSEVK